MTVVEEYAVRCAGIGYALTQLGVEARFAQEIDGRLVTGRGSGDSVISGRTTPPDAPFYRHQRDGTRITSSTTPMRSASAMTSAQSRRS